MKVFVAGATGAVGRPLVARLLEAGHDVVGTTRREDRAADLRAQGAEPVGVDALDADALATAVRRARPEVIVQQLTALPQAGTAEASDHAATSRLRLEGTRALLRGAPDPRMIAQSVAFFTRPDGRPVHDEDAELFVDGPGSVGVNARRGKCLGAARDGNRRQARRWPVASLWVLLRPGYLVPPRRRPSPRDTRRPHADRRRRPRTLVMGARRRCGGGDPGRTRAGARRSERL
jgi:nucleoside-diphosphate-sugar epimerase